MFKRFARNVCHENVLTPSKCKSVKIYVISILSAKSFQKLVALKRLPVSRDVATSLCATLKHYTESCVFAVFARLQWAVPRVQHLQAAFTANAELPRRCLVRCALQHCALCNGSSGNSAACCRGLAASPALSPRHPFSQTHDGSCLIAAVIRRIAMPNIFSR